MRTGIDLRRRKKPSAFFELVDTRWDEYNRVAEMNTMMLMNPPPVTTAPAAGPGLMEGYPVPPASDPGTMPDSSHLLQPRGYGPPPESQLPGNSNGDNSFDPDPPTSNSPGSNSPGSDSTGGEPSRLPENDDIPDSPALPHDAPTARRSAVDSSQMSASAKNDMAADLSLAAGPPQTSAARPSRRPMASRLFSRPQ